MYLFLQELVNNMSDEECRRHLISIVRRNPSVVLDLQAVDQRSEPSVSASWCICALCDINTTKPIEQKCCGRQPGNCLSQQQV